MYKVAKKTNEGFKIMKVKKRNRTHQNKNKLDTNTNASKKSHILKRKIKKTNEFIYNKKFGYKHKKCWFQINIEVLG